MFGELGLNEHDGIGSMIAHRPTKDTDCAEEDPVVRCCNEQCKLRIRGMVWHGIYGRWTDVERRRAQHEQYLPTWMFLSAPILA